LKTYRIAVGFTIEDHRAKGTKANPKRKPARFDPSGPDEPDATVTDADLEALAADIKALVAMGAIEPIAATAPREEEVVL
jgi:hypothetical protein